MSHQNYRIKNQLIFFHHQLKVRPCGCEAAELKLNHWSIINIFNHSEALSSQTGGVSTNHRGGGRTDRWRPKNHQLCLYPWRQVSMTLVQCHRNRGQRSNRQTDRQTDRSTGKLWVWESHDSIWLVCPDRSDQQKHDKVRREKGSGAPLPPAVSPCCVQNMMENWKFYLSVREDFSVMSVQHHSL